MKLRGTSSREQEIIERQVGHVTRLVDDLLDLSRIFQGKIELRKQRVELADVIVHALETASPLLEQRQHQVEIRVERQGLTVDVDPDRMAQVISNLLTNAAKYSDPGSKITIRAKREGPCVRCSVKDDGIGISPQMLERIFDIFVQQPQSLERASGGLGLGLAIVRSLVEMHGGTVSARSEGPGAGSEFTVELPLVGRIDEEAQRQPSLSRAERQSAKARGTRILIVDDNRDAAATLAEVFEQLGYPVEVAHDGPAALALAETFCPDIALVDIGLPVMNGYELAERLQKLGGRSRELHLVALTGYGQDSDRRRSTKAGFGHHLVKPANLNELEQLIEQLSATD